MVRTRAAGRQPQSTESSRLDSGSQPSNTRPLRPRCSKARKSQYNASTSSDDESDPSSESYSSENANQTQPRSSEVRPRSSVVKTHVQQQIPSATSQGRRRPGRPPSKSSSGISSSTSPQNEKKRSRVAVVLPMRQGRIPNWCDPRVPYEAWVAIFLFASGNTNGSWLIDCATVCKTFLEPALSALYRKPMPGKPKKLKRLIEVLQMDPADTLMNYRAKVESLTLDIRDVHVSSYFPLIHPLTRLQELYIITHMDQPPYRELDKTLRWSYPDALFEALNAGSDESHNMAESDSAASNRYLPLSQKPYATALRSWEWSGRMLGGQASSLDALASMHQKPYFQSLTSLSFTNFQTPSMLRLATNASTQSAPEDIDRAAAMALAHAIAQLKMLRHLTFEACTTLDDVLLPLLPKDLSHLTLINCWEVRSDDFAAFLLTSGHHMRSLTLLHCQSLNLEFLTTLGTACPGLEELTMDLSYYRLHNSLNDSDPMYDYVLLPDQIPQWPTSLKVLDIENLRDSSVETVDMFLTSLVSNAGFLTNLRHLVIKMSLKIPWQDRARMRNDWRQKLETTFLRKSQPPEPVQTFEEVAVPDTPPRKKRKNHQSDEPRRRSGRLYDKGRRSRSTSKSLRKKSYRLDYRDPDTDADEDLEASLSDASDDGASSESGSESGERDESGPTSVIQGMCNTVDIQFDNQKPSELQYGMEDFQDGGTDSEDEWNGDEEEDDTLAWR